MCFGPASTSRLSRLVLASAPFRHRFDSGLILLLIVAIVYLGGYFTLFAVRQREVSAFTADDDPRS